MSSSVKIGIRVGSGGFLVGMFLMFIFMGLPVGNILLAIPMGIITGRFIVKRKKFGESISEKDSLQAGLISGALSSLGIIIPLIIIIIMAPEGATIGQEFSKWINPNIIPQPLNSIPVAMILGAMICAINVIGLTVVCVILTVRSYERGRSSKF